MHVSGRDFADLTREVGVDAVLVVDLPVEEADELTAALTHNKIGTIFLISPTTTLDG